MSKTGERRRIAGDAEKLTPVRGAGNNLYGAFGNAHRRGHQSGHGSIGFAFIRRRGDRNLEDLAIGCGHDAQDGIARRLGGGLHRQDQTIGIGGEECAGRHGCLAHQQHLGPDNDLAQEKDDQQQHHRRQVQGAEHGQHPPDTIQGRFHQLMEAAAYHAHQLVTGIDDIEVHQPAENDRDDDRPRVEVEDDIDDLEEGDQQGLHGGKHAPEGWMGKAPLT